jgi:drug/metabolite transporter (DMT)-like permease
MNATNRPSIPISSIIMLIATPTLLGVAPIFGKFAINAGATPFAVAAIRSVLAALILWVVYLLFFRRYIYIYPAGLLGCVVVGIINGIGSLFYYGGLGLLDASMVQLINGMYLVFALMMSRIGGQAVDRRTIVRVGLALLALIMITGFAPEGSIDPLGVGLMLGSALMFAGTVVLSQYVLYEMPSATVTLYIITTMAILVMMVWMTVGEPISTDAWNASISPIFFLGISTALARLAMFAGVKLLGGMQTAILAIAEIGVALVLSAVLLDDTLTLFQWVGVGVLFFSMMLIRQPDLLPRGYNPNALIVANMASVQFQRIAFHRAFGTQEHDNEAGTMTTITTQEMMAIQRMMGAERGVIDPYPISKINRLNQEWNESTQADDDVAQV